MERLKNITIIFLLAVGLLASAAPAKPASRLSGKPASVLLQEGLYAEEIEGDLDAAIKIYEQVIAEAKETQRAAAQATYRIGMCYLKKGQKGKAAIQFGNLVSKFPDQKALIAKAQKQLAKLKPPASGFGPAERVPVEQLIKSGKVPAFKTQIYDNSGLDLETGVSVPFMDEWPTLCDVAWDNDGGGALMINPKSSVRFLALGAAEKWKDAISMARNSLAVLRTSTSKGMFASQSKFVAILTSEGNLAVIQIGRYDQEKGTIYWWLEKLPAHSFGPVIERVISSEETGKPFFFDLDTAKAFSPPPGLTRSSPPSEVIEWSRTKGIDFINDRGRLELTEMTAVKVESSLWESATRAEIRDALMKGSTQKILRTHSKDYTISSPITYAFETREGGIGLLQILEKKNENLRIRYKMLQKPDVRGLSISPHRKLLDERTLIAINKQDRFGAKWFKVEREYEAASQSKKQQMIEKWMADAQKPDVKIRSSAIASLGNIACKQASDILIKIAKEPLEFSRSNRPRWIAVRSLGRIGDMRAVPVLIDLLDHYNKDTQLYARVALCEITGVYFGSDKTKWRNWWQQKLPDIETLIKEMHQPEAQRFAALNKLINIGAPAVEPLISELQKSNDWQVPKALGAIGDKRAVEPLIKKWQKCDWSPMKEVISEALERITGKKLGRDKQKWDKWWRETKQFISPEATIQSFMAAALNRRGAMVFVAGDSHDYKDIKAIFENPKHPFNSLFRKIDPSVPVKILETKIIDNMCEAVWQVTFKEDFTIEGKTFKAGETFDIDGNLHRYGDKWLITGI